MEGTVEDEIQHLHSFGDLEASRLLGLGCTYSGRPEAQRKSTDLRRFFNGFERRP